MSSGKMPDILTGLMQEAGIWKKSKEDSEPPTSDADKSIEPEAGEIEPRWTESTDEYLLKLGETIRRQNLPVRERRQDLMDAFAKTLDKDEIFLFEAETGAGKSLYSALAIRKKLRELGRPERVIVVENRKDAARNAARGMAAISQESLGDEIAYSTSEEKVIEKNASIMVVTSGIFLRWIKDGRVKRDEVGAIIIDEAHEGSQDYHLILGFLKRMRKEGAAPPAVLMSATLPTKELENFFGTDKNDSFFIEGRQFPVDVSFEGPEDENQNYIGQAAEVIKRECASDEDGDILVFMPGMAEIEETINRVGQIPGIQVMKLYADLEPQVRDSVLLGNKPPGVRRRVIVSTNVAETSVTPPNVTLVIDPCRQRAVYFDLKSGTEKRGTEFISQRQSEQRKGRAGRVREGRAIRLLSEAQFSELNVNPVSEIQRANLSQLILKLADMGADPLEFDFIDPPSREALEYGKKELVMLGALDEKGNLTEIGREMALLPFTPRVARMLVEAKRSGHLEAALVMGAFTREKKVFNDPEEKYEKKQAQYARSEFSRGNSDWLRNLNIFAEAIKQGVYEYDYLSRKKNRRRRLSEHEEDVINNFESWCKRYYLHPYALTHIAYRLTDYARSARVRLDREKLPELLKDDGDDEKIGDAILAAYPENLMYSTYGGYDQIGGEKETGVTLSFMSEASKKQSGLIVVEGMVKKAQAPRWGGAGEMHIRAWGAHPLTPEQVDRAFPNLLKKSLRSRFGSKLVEYDEEAKGLRANFSYALENNVVVHEGEYKVGADEAAKLLLDYLNIKVLNPTDYFGKPRSLEETELTKFKNEILDFIALIERYGFVLQKETRSELDYFQKKVTKLLQEAQQRSTYQNHDVGYYPRIEPAMFTAANPFRRPAYPSSVSWGEREVEKEVEKPAIPKPPKIVKEAPAKKEKKEVTKKSLEEEMEVATALISAARTTYLLSTKSFTKKEIIANGAIKDLIERSKSLDWEAREIKKLLNVEAPNLTSLEGSVTSLQKSIKSMYAKYLSLIDASYSEQRLTAYSEAFAQMAQAVLQNHDAKVYIDAGMITLNEMVESARREFKLIASPITSTPEKIKASVEQAITTAVNLV